MFLLAAFLGLISFIIQAMLPKTEGVVFGAFQGGTAAEIGRKLFTVYLLPFEVTSVLILIAICGRDRACEKGDLKNAGSVPMSWYLILSAILFGLGVAGFIYRRNIITVFMSIELMLNAVNLTFITFSYTLKTGGRSYLQLLRDGGCGGGGGCGLGDYSDRVQESRDADDR